MYVYGKNVLEDIIKNKKRINKAYLYKNTKENNYIDYLVKHNIKINYLEKYEMDRMVNGVHQGIILDIEDYNYSSLEEILDKENSLIVILDHLEDPHNLGAIVRTCEAAGVDGIIIPKDRSVEVNSTVYKTSVGTVDRVKIIQVTNIVNTMNELKKSGYWIAGTDMAGTNYKDIDYSGKFAIVIGNEGHGMSRLVKENVDFVATIPMKGEVNSLNASVAAGIIIFEAASKRELG